MGAKNGLLLAFFKGKKSINQLHSLLKQNNGTGKPQNHQLIRTLEFPL
jgi:hypothetical protein